MLIEDDAHLLPVEELGEQGLALFNRLTAQIPTIKLKQIERVCNGNETFA